MPCTSNSEWLTVRAGTRADLHTMSTALQTNKEIEPSPERQKPLMTHDTLTSTPEIDQQNEEEGMTGKKKKFVGL